MSRTAQARTLIALARVCLESSREFAADGAVLEAVYWRDRAALHLLAARHLLERKHAT